MSEAIEVTVDGPPVTVRVTVAQFESYLKRLGFSRINSNCPGLREWGIRNKECVVGVPDETMGHDRAVRWMTEAVKDIAYYQGRRPAYKVLSDVAGSPEILLADAVAQERAARERVEKIADAWKRLAMSRGSALDHEQAGTSPHERDAMNRLIALDINPDISELLPIAAASLGVVPMGAITDEAWALEVLSRAGALQDAMKREAAGGAEAEAKMDVEVEGHGGVEPNRPPHPHQPIFVDERGVVRFKPNRIVEWMLEQGRAGQRFDLHAIETRDFPDDDRIQLAQLIGYSVDVFGGLHYVPDELAAECDRQATAILRGAPEARGDTNTTKAEQLDLRDARAIIRIAGNMLSLGNTAAAIDILRAELGALPLAPTGNASLDSIIAAIRAALATLDVRDPDGLPITGRAERAADILRAALEGYGPTNSGQPTKDVSNVVCREKGSRGYVCTREAGHVGDHIATAGPEIDRWPASSPSRPAASALEKAFRDMPEHKRAAFVTWLRASTPESAPHPAELAAADAIEALTGAASYAGAPPPRPAPDLERIAREEARSAVPKWHFKESAMIWSDSGAIITTTVQEHAERVIADIIIRALRRAARER